MQLCFMFINSNDAKNVEQFLSNQFDVEATNYNGYDMLYVPEKDYQKAICEGIMFITDNDIQSAWWVNTQCRQMPINCVPLLYAKIPTLFNRIDLLRKIADSLCRMYAKMFEKHLEQPILIQYTAYNNVQFRLVRNDETVKKNEYYIEEISKYCLAHYYIFNYISVCDAFGKILTTINRNHSVEWPTKTPH